MPAKSVYHCLIGLVCCQLISHIACVIQQAWCLFGLQGSCVGWCLSTSTFSRALNMAQQERTINPPVNAPIASLAKTSARPSLSPLRHRPLNRAATFADNYPSLRHRRSSNFSESAQSFKSSTDDLLLPRAKRPEDVVQHEEHSHWHSVPLALALLPAVGGLAFKNGGAVVTDVTLLALAAIFLNWSVRLPW